MIIKSLIHKALEIPFVFDFQQKFCQDYKDVKAEFADYILKDGLDILEVGCSTGLLASVVFDMKKQNYTGIDIDKNYVDLASQKYPDGKFLEMDARNMTFTKKFDIIMFNGAMHHLEDQIIVACFGEAKKFLKEGGKILVSEPIFVRTKIISTMLLKMDRGNYIRSEEGYEKFFTNFKIVRKRHFKFSIHRFVSYVLENN